ncbi:hypothetical protein CDAR_508451 [Caerostris darwini]|uniref:Uncharacterized protein n=1 Tax=Caerostris darwini TaxID=1538125 RepID=A0AAV4N1E9_9ARAC|nr:hypothetical protein CDAR_508451 [Caerostris darwini]
MQRSRTYHVKNGWVGEGRKKRCANDKKRGWEERTLRQRFYRDGFPLTCSCRLLGICSYGDNISLHDLLSCFWQTNAYLRATENHIDMFGRMFQSPSRHRRNSLAPGNIKKQTRGRSFPESKTDLATGTITRNTRFADTEKSRSRPIAVLFRVVGVAGRPNQLEGDIGEEGRFFQRELSYVNDG